MNGRRALEIIDSFGKGQVAFTAPEIEELLKLQLVVETDPRDVASLMWLDPVVQEHAETSTVEDLAVPTKLAAKLAEVDEKLKSSWSRLTTRDSKVKEQETERRTLRRALAMVKDPGLIARLVTTRETMRRVATNFVPCKTLGDELYATTAKAGRVYRALALRVDRFGDQPLSAFMKQFEKTETKMEAFGGEIATLANNIGYVKKNPHQVVIGLAKSGMPPAEAIGTYRAAAKATGAPDVAVTLTRNASQGGTQAAAQKLRAAEAALKKTGFPPSPEIIGAAKTLLPYDPVETGVDRFVAIVNAVLGAGFTRDRTGERLDVAIKCTARLMPATGTPAELVNRVLWAIDSLRKRPTKVTQIDEPMLATALASMVRESSAVDPLVERFRQIETELVRGKVSSSTAACGHALECVACPGTPLEVVDTVASLAMQVAAKASRQSPNSADVAVAVSFAKRFAY